MLTADNTAQGEQWRGQFFEFVRELTGAQFDLKLLLALRTEFLGRFGSHLRFGLRGPGVYEYFLDELNEEQIKEAVERPTATTKVGTLDARSTTIASLLITASPMT